MLGLFAEVFGDARLPAALGFAGFGTAHLAEFVGRGAQANAVEQDGGVGVADGEDFAHHLHFLDANRVTHFQHDFGFLFFLGFGHFLGFLRDFFLGLFKVLADFLGLGFLRLSLLDFLDGALDLAVGFRYKFLSLSRCVAEILFFLALKFGQKFFVFLHHFGQKLVGNAQVLFFLADGLFVDFQLLQLLLEFQVLVTGDVGCVVEDLFRKADFLGDFKGERGTRLACKHNVHWLHKARVEKHCPIDDALVVVGQKFQVGIVRRDHTESLFLVEFQQNGLGDGSA